MDRRAVIFDMDGVLVDSYSAHFAAWQRLGAQLGRSITEAEFASVFGRRNREIIQRFWGDLVPEGDVAAWSDRKESMYREILLKDFPAMDGVGELLDALKAAGFALAIGSSGPPENIEAVLDGLGRQRFFDAVTGGLEVAHGKPDPEVFLLTARKLGLPPHRCAVIEDSVHGLEAARRAGAVPIALAGTAPHDRLAEWADLVADSLRELSPRRIADLIDRNPPLTKP